MNDEQLKIQIGTNIALYRKRFGLTQAGLAAKLNYSDKAISKWERGESIPDVITLLQLAEQFEITVNDLVADPNALPEDSAPGKLEKAMTKVSEKALKRKANKNVIQALSSTLVWFVALLIFVAISSFDIPYSWLAFLYAVPVNAIVLLSLRSAWRDFRWNRWLISMISWGFLVAIHASLMVFLKFNMWRIFLLGIPGEVATTLWFRLFSTGREERKEVTENA
jgi:transcriptional regulator with XRE-family HTH domain